VSVDPQLVTTYDLSRVSLPGMINQLDRVAAAFACSEREP
jgi:hypothetical protein